MVDINAWTLQTMLKAEKAVTLAWLQDTLDLNYQEARQLAGLLMQRGWLGEETPSGFPVGKDCLFLRYLERSEVGTLVNELNNECGSLLNQLLEDQEEGTDYKNLSKVLRSERGTRETIDILVRNKLIFVKGDRYYLRVNRSTVEAIREMLCQKRMMERRDKNDKEKLIACFDKLFE